MSYLNMEKFFLYTVHAPLPGTKGVYPYCTSETQKGVPVFKFADTVSVEEPFSPATSKEDQPLFKLRGLIIHVNQTPVHQILVISSCEGPGDIGIEKMVKGRYVTPLGQVIYLGDSANPALEFLVCTAKHLTTLLAQGELRQLVLDTFLKDHLKLPI